jgi:hypothetical protein
MTNEEQVAQVREQIISIVTGAITTNMSYPKGLTWNEMADEILSIPELKILAPDQTRPIMYNSELVERFTEEAVQQDMLKDNWVKVV